MTLRTLASISSIAVGILAAQNAYGQRPADGAAPADQAQSGTVTTGQPAPAGGSPAGALGDIVVTANKQSQTLQRTPVAITAISGTELVQKGITDIRAVQAFVPSVRFQLQSSTTEIYIRGVGATQDHAQFDPPTSVYFNGIYMPREVASTPFYDISQIEVLPGPQGTLYGRSSLGGVVTVNFARPTHQYESDLVMEAGNYSLAHLTATQNVPITDTLAVRGSFDFNRHSGYLTSGAESKDDWSGRLSLLYTPTDRISAYLWGMITDVNGRSTNAVAIGVRPDGTLDPGTFLNSNPWNDLLPASVLAQSPFGQPKAQRTSYENHIFGGEFSVGLNDNLTLTYIPSYLKFFASDRFGLSGLPNIQDIHFEQTTHELRLAGKAGWGSWLLGAYGYYMTSSGHFYVGTYDFTGIPVTEIDHNRLKGAAVFGQTTINITRSLRATIGARYGADDRTGRGPYPVGAGLAEYNFSKSYHRFDYKAGIDYDIAPHILVYAAIQTGFQPGTFNTFANPGSTDGKADPVAPAKLTAYTAGFKSRLLDGKLQFNSEFFYYDYKGLFATAYNAFLSQTQAFNAKKTQIYGNQTDIVIKPSSQDQINFSLGYLHARYKSFTLPDGSANFDGNQLQFAPNWTISGGYYHDFDLPTGYIRASATSRYESKFYADYAHTPGTRQKPYAKVDASITYYDNGGRWSLGLWGKNLTNIPVIAAAGSGSSFPANPNAGTAYLEDPRTYGVRATLKF